MGITNQRETTVAWNRVTGVPYYNAIVWDDARTADIANRVAAGDMDRLRDRTGLPVTTYFAGCKVKWLLDHVEALRVDLQERPHEVCLGTIDTWLVYQFTGHKRATTDNDNNNIANNNALFCGGAFVTDVTNASRWLFMDLRTLRWNQSLVDAVCAPHRVPLTALPTICPSSHRFGTCNGAVLGVDLLDGVPIAAVLGDQQAALFGQTAFAAGQAKNTYGTGMFLM